MEKKVEEKNEKIEQNKKEEQITKKGFFKKMWYSIYKIEKYSELSAEGFWKAVKYLLGLVAILAIVVSCATLYKTNKEVLNVITYVENEIPDFSYSDKTLKMDSTEVIEKNEESLGKVIIDVNQENEDEINKYISSISENGVIVLKNKIIIKEIGLTGTISYNYEDLFSQIGLTEFNKQDLIEYAKSTKILSLYGNLFAVLFLYSFTIYLLNMLIYAFVISIFGYLATIITKLKIKYVAIFNMAIYAITLSTLLNILYVGINTIFNYSIEYFDVMYILVAAIYMIAAIFILKSEFIKKQSEVTKIIEVEKEVKEEMNKKDQEKKEEEQKENKEPDEKQKENENKEKKKKDEGEEPEGSNA